MWESVIVPVLWFCNHFYLNLSVSLPFSTIWSVWNCRPPNCTYSSPFRVPKHLLVLKKSRWSLLEYMYFSVFLLCILRKILLWVSTMLAYVGFMFCVCTFGLQYFFFHRTASQSQHFWITPHQFHQQVKPLHSLWITFGLPSPVDWFQAQQWHFVHTKPPHFPICWIPNGVQAASCDFMMGVHS